jgi:hypothetical protein
MDIVNCWIPRLSDVCDMRITSFGSLRWKIPDSKNVTKGEILAEIDCIEKESVLPDYTLCIIAEISGKIKIIKPNSTIVEANEIIATIETIPKIRSDKLNLLGISF